MDDPTTPGREWKAGFPHPWIGTPGPHLQRILLVRHLL